MAGGGEGSTEIFAPRTHGAIASGLVSDDEIVILMMRPSLLFVPLSCAMSLVVIALVAFVLAWIARWQTWVGWTDRQALALGVGLGALRLGWQALEWYARVYVLTDRRIVRRRGVLRVAVFQCELSRIQHTNVFQRVRERLFGLGTIGFATAGSDVFEAYWVMVRDPFAVHKIVVDAVRRYGGRAL